MVGAVPDAGGCLREGMRRQYLRLPNRMRELAGTIGRLAGDACSAP